MNRSELHAFLESERRRGGKMGTGSLKDAADAMLAILNRKPGVVTQALGEFVRAIDATGGISRDELGNPCPIGDPIWIDLGECYVQACRALAREPKVQGEE